MIYPGNQYVVYVVKPSAVRPGKTDKITVHPVTGRAHDTHDPSIWMTHEIAQAMVDKGVGHGVGIVLTDRDPLFAVDLDCCRMEDGSWSPLATQLCAYFAGCYVEVSHSGDGLHIIGTTSLAPEHRTRDIYNAGTEMYTKLRFIALTGTSATGSMSHNADIQLNWLIDNYFPPTGAVTPSDWTDTACPEWSGPSDDNDLVRRMLASTGNPFSNSIPVADLWAGICDPNGQSEADAALVSHLAFWTGKNCERIDRLFRMSGLMRDKWDRSAGQGRTYGQLTIAKYGTTATAVYGERPTVTNLPPELTAPPADTDTGNYRGGGQILTIQNQVNYFKGCVYVSDAHGVFCPTGDILDQGRFRAMYGGYEFMVEEGNSKGIKNAWEAFTESRGYTFPKAQGTCFRPERPAGAVLVEQGRSMINTYVPVITEIKPGDPTRFLQHLAKMVPDQNDYDILLAYMAAVVQYPGVKFQWCPLLIGMEGNGKSLIVSILSHCIGDRYVHLPDSQDLDNKFNSWLQGKLLIGIEEVYTSDRSSLIEVLKPMITNRRIGLQGKGANQITGDNRANFILSSNHKDAIRKTGTDRRYAIFYTAQQEPGDLERDGMDGDYFPQLYNWMYDGGSAIINGYLRAYQIPDALNPATLCQRAPRTTSTDEALTASMGPVEQEIMEQVAMGTSGFAGGWISSAAVDKLLADNRRSVSRNKRKEIMIGMGYIHHPALPDGRVHNHLPEGGKPRLYVQRNSLLAQLTRPIDVVARYLEAQQGAGLVGSAWGVQQQPQGAT